MKKMLYLAYIVSMTALLVTFAPKNEEEGGGGLANLDGFRWENRLIIVFSSKEERAETVAQLRSIDEEAALADRDIIWFVVTGTVIDTNYVGDLNDELVAYLRDRYQVDQTDEVDVVLIGKDGGVKFRDSQLDTDQIYGQIDQMPMRRAEMGADAAPGNE